VKKKNRQKEITKEKATVRGNASLAQGKKGKRRAEISSASQGKSQTVNGDKRALLSSPRHKRPQGNKCVGKKAGEKKSNRSKGKESNERPSVQKNSVQSTSGEMETTHAHGKGTAGG